jgi:hypothetical protein
VSRLKTRIAVLEALRKAENKASRRDLKVARKELARRLDTLNHAHEQMVADRSLFLRADEYVKSEDLHRQEREAQASRIGVLEIRLTQVATVGAILLLLVPFLTLAASHYLFK